MRRNLILFVAGWLIVLTACTSATSPTLAPTPPLTRVAVSRPSPTRAPTSAPTPTSRPISTATNTARPTALNPNPTTNRVLLPLPTGEPVSLWNGIPIMPNAIAGKMDTALYSFSTKATPSQVQDYYQKELAPSGWELRDVQKSESEPTFLALLFTRSDALSISILANVQGDVTVVLIVA